MKFIAITGIIGAGKSSVARELSKLSGFPLVEEDFGQNPFLERYYENQSRYAAQMQMWFLLRRLEQLESLKDGTYVLDQPLGAFGYVFPMMQNSMGYMTSEVTNSIINLYKNFDAALECEQYCVLLDVDVDVAMERIHSRGREMEKAIPRAYLERLSSEYSKFFAHHQTAGTKSLTISNNDGCSVEQVAADILELYNRGVWDTRL